MQIAKKIGERVVKYAKKNSYYLIGFTYIVIVTAYSSKFIFKYGEARFFLFYILGYLTLVLILKLFSKKPWKKKTEK